ncbi:hypothetical protein Mhypo_02944 [Meiothermus hypogaeus]|uniref:Uncharacterized protein n=1 Tax=Meiothermus hypogaeus TaxID=884155 RepID=A0ABX9MJX4_9DEIN|nr:hypothetical protein Mhypo_02944 [Meiothermus hypogaeus]
MVQPGPAQAKQAQYQTEAHPGQSAALQAGEPPD